MRTRCSVAKSSKRSDRRDPTGIPRCYHLVLLSRRLYQPSVRDCLAEDAPGDRCGRCRSLVPRFGPGLMPYWHQTVRGSAVFVSRPPLVGHTDLLVAQQIAWQLRHDHPDDPEMWVSHETIYQSLFVQGRGALRAELHRCLRTGGPPSTGRPGHVLRSHQGHGPAQRAAGRGRGSSGARPLGRRPDHRQGHPLGDRHAGGTPDPLRAALQAADGRTAEAVRTALTSTHPAAARRTAPEPDLGSRQGDVRARPVHRRDRRQGLLLRSAQPVAAGQQREHQRPAASVLPQGHGPVRP